jgi:hypothetical protein
MNQDRWKQIDLVLGRVLDLPPEKRAIYLATVYAHDRALRDAVESMLDDAIEHAADARFKAATDAAAMLITQENRTSPQDRPDPLPPAR